MYNVVVRLYYQVSKQVLTRHTPRRHTNTRTNVSNTCLHGYCYHRYTVSLSTNINSNCISTATLTGDHIPQNLLQPITLSLDDGENDALISLFLNVRYIFLSRLLFGEEEEDRHTRHVVWSRDDVT